VRNHATADIGEGGSHATVLLPGHGGSHIPTQPVEVLIEDVAHLFGRDHPGPEVRRCAHGTALHRIER